MSLLFFSRWTVIYDVKVIINLDCIINNYIHTYADRMPREIVLYSI